MAIAGDNWPTKARKHGIGPSPAPAAIRLATATIPSTSWEASRELDGARPRKRDKERASPLLSPQSRATGLRDKRQGQSEKASLRGALDSAHPPPPPPVSIDHMARRKDGSAAPPSDGIPAPILHRPMRLALGHPACSRLRSARHMLGRAAAVTV
jgi:hypothetical protein